MKLLPLYLLSFLSIACALPLEAQCQTQKLNGSQTVPRDFLGKACDIDGTQAVVGAYSVENSSPGSAYVYELMGSSWIQTARLTPGDIGGSNDQFGNSVGISNDRVVVGSEFNTNALGNNAGAAYVFEKSGGSWNQVAKLTAFGASKSVKFGECVVIDGDVIVVGNRQDGSVGNNSGAAFVFERLAGTWTGVAKLIASDASRNDLSADALAVQGNRIVMGSYRNDASGGNSGAAYVFDKIGGTWQETGKLVAQDSAGEMSRSIALDGGRILLGARRDGTRGSDAGAGYVFELQNGSWVQSAKLFASNAASGDLLGEACGLEGDRLVLSSHFNDLGGTDSGTAFVFELRNGSWVEVDRLKGSDTVSGDQFSHSIGMSGDYIVAGAPFNNGSRGAGYIFSYDPAACGAPMASVSSYGENLGGANIGTLRLTGTPNAGSQVDLLVSSIPSGTTGFVWVSTVQLANPFRGGTLLARFSMAPIKYSLTLVGGGATVPFNIPSNIAGLTVYSQAAAMDDTQAEGLAFTNGLMITIGA